MVGEASYMLIYKNVNYSFVSRVHKVDYASAGHNCFEFSMWWGACRRDRMKITKLGGCGRFFEVYKNLQGIILKMMISVSRG